MPTLPLTCALSLSALSLSAAASGTSFTPLPLGPQGTGYLSPTGVSADGSVVTGGSYIVGSGNQARRWRNGIGFDYPGPSVGATATWCSGLSADGLVISGGSGHAAFGDLEGWMRYGASVGHVGTPPGHDTSDCVSVSADGIVTVGYGGLQSNPNLFEAAYYTEQNDWTNLGFLPGGGNSKATCCSFDGSVIAGWSANAAGTGSAFVWTAASGMLSIGNLPGGVNAAPASMSFDGSVIVGTDDPGPTRGFRWTAAGGMVDIGSFTPGVYVWAEGVSDDGNVIVGSADDNGSNSAFVWDAAHGMRRLRDLLVAQGLGANLANWDLFSADCIRGTGPWFIAGLGGNNNYYEAFVVELDSLDPPAGTPICFGDGSQSVACPCANSGTTGRGCANSQPGSGGARLAGFGTPALDDVVLDVAGMLPTSLCIFLQGSSLAPAAVPFGDGLRCVGGALKRLASHNAVNGASAYPQAGELSIRARSALLGDTIPNGSTRHYQVYYRDPSASFCPAPQGGTFNISNGTSIQW